MPNGRRSTVRRPDSQSHARDGVVVGPARSFRGSAHARFELVVATCRDRGAWLRCIQGGVPPDGRNPLNPASAVITHASLAGLADGTFTSADARWTLAD